MNIYLENGFADMHKIMALPYPLIFVIGGRGTGKTYGAVDVLLNLPHDEKFFFLRRTQDEADTIAYTDFSPFQPVINDNPDKYKPVVVQKIPHVKNISGVWYGEPNDDSVLVPVGDAIGYIGALSTIHKIRGFNMQQVTIGVYDEFIPEKHVASFRNGSEGDALLNAIETIARNRELLGQKPFKMVCLSNANTIASPVFQSLGIIDTVNKMAMKGKQECILPERGIAVFIFRDSPISEAKRNTTLYKAAKDGDFATMALKNDFDSATYLYIQQQPLKEYRIVSNWADDVYIYRHKNAYPARYYVTRHKSGTPKRNYHDDEMSKKRFKRNERVFLDAWLSGNVAFSDYYCKYILTNIL